MTQAAGKTNKIDPITETEYALIIQTAQSARPGETPQQAALRDAVDIAAVGLMHDGMFRPGETADASWKYLLR